MAAQWRGGVTSYPYDVDEIFMPGTCVRQTSAPTMPNNASVFQENNSAAGHVRTVVRRQINASRIQISLKEFRNAGQTAGDVRHTAGDARQAPVCCQNCLPGAGQSPMCS